MQFIKEKKTMFWKMTTSYITCIDLSVLQRRHPLKCFEYHDGDVCNLPTFNIQPGKVLIN